MLELKGKAQCEIIEEIIESYSPRKDQRTDYYESSETYFRTIRNLMADQHMEGYYVYLAHYLI